MNSRQFIIGSLVALLVVIALALAISLDAVFMGTQSAANSITRSLALPQLPAIPDVPLRFDSSPLALLIPLAAICLPILGLLGILGFVLALRYMRMKETAMLLDRGVTAGAIAQQRAGRPARTVLFVGIVISMIGLALSVALYPIGILAGSRYPLALGPWMIPGLVPLFIGVALVLWHFLNDKQH